MSTPFKPRFIAQTECSALIPHPDHPNIDLQCGEPATCWANEPKFHHPRPGHPRCSTHQDQMSPGIDLSHNTCLAQLKIPFE